MGYVDLTIEGTSAHAGEAPNEGADAMGRRSRTPTAFHTTPTG